jgi:endonuclease/exonuclease/phosphatase family metal-dependent hydrolase
MLAASLGLAEPVRIMAWNVEWFPGREPDSNFMQERVHMAEVRHALRRFKPDVLILTEVKSADAVKRAIRVVPGLKLNAITAFDGRSQQIAIASRYPMIRGGQAPWVRFFNGPPRGCAFAELALASNTCLQVYGLHLKSNRGPQIVNRTLRELSAAQLLHFKEHLGAGTSCPTSGVVIGGDLNTNLDDAMFDTDDSLRYLIGSGYFWPFAGLSPEKRKTWLGSGYYAPAQFDHFVTFNTGKPSARLLKTGRISDHVPIEIVIDTADIR